MKPFPDSNAWRECRPQTLPAVRAPGGKPDASRIRPNPSPGGDGFATSRPGLGLPKANSSRIRHKAFVTDSEGQKDKVSIVILSLLSLFSNTSHRPRAHAFSPVRTREGPGDGYGFDLASAYALSRLHAIGNRYFQPARRRVGHAKWSPARFDFLFGEILARAAQGARLEVV
jgi:hypothetical protein